MLWWEGYNCGVSRETFYDPKQIAILPTGFCFPGTGSSGAPAWREQLLAKLKRVEVTLVLGQYAQAYHFGNSKGTLTDLVKDWRTHWPGLVPLPHPSPRNNPWFEADLVPALQKRVAEALTE